jgi:lipid-A-disaccharide synthase-like uncharacterized protein
MTDLQVHSVGFIAQGLFSARLLVQWIKSERAGRVLSPTLFWQLSLAASFMLIVYGILVKDITVLLGQAISYFIYIRNLRLKRAWRFIPLYFRAFTLLFPLFGIAWLIYGSQYNWKEMVEGNPLSPMLIWGGLGQVVFTFRFVFQWYFSEKKKRSVLPLGFWIISIAGSLMICSYALYNALYPIIFGQLFGLVIYIRNVFIHYKIGLRKRSN